MSSTNKPSNKPCSACKFLRRKCTQQCIFAPYFPADKPQLFAYVHSVYGASNVGKILHELSASQRADCVKSVTYEAEARIRDPVYGCVGTVYELQQRMRQLNTELQSGKEALSTYGPQAMQDLQAMMTDPNMAKAMMAMMANSMGKVMPKQYGANNAGFPLYENNNIVAARHNQLVIQQQELLEAQQLAAAQQQRELMMMYYEQQQQQHQPLVAAPHNQSVIQYPEQQEILEAQQLAAAQQQRELMMRSYEQQQPLLAAPHNQSVIQDAEQQELLVAQQLAAAQQQRELMIRSFEQQQQQQQQEFMRYGGFEPVGGGGSGGGLNQMGGGGPARLALGNFDNVNLYQIQRQQQQGEQHHHPDTHVPHSHPHAIEAQQHLDKQGLEDLLSGGGGGGLARLTLDNFDNVSLDQIQKQQQGEQQHHHPHNHVPHSHLHAIDAQQHNDKQGLEDLLGGGGPPRLALDNFDNVGLYHIQPQQQGEQQHHHLHTHVPHSHPHAIETQQLLSPQQHHDKQRPEDLLSVFDKEFLEDILSSLM